MNADTLLIFGGIGLFLLGMVILTEGLRQLAGDTLRRILSRFTRTPLRGVLAGAMTTAVVQSSSATTVIAVGFVGAGLLTFSQGLGIILGANIGTTVTGWIVAIVGFKLKLGVITLPLVLVGVLLRLFGSGKLRHFGWVLAGFSLLFVGIDAMQGGMAQFKGVITPADFPSEGLTGRLLMVFLGVAVTLVTQSSSAGIATALVALSAGTISFSQAAAMVIGMDVGTTFTAVLATLGGSTAMRQTGYAHVVFNLMMGAMAFFLLGPYVSMAESWSAISGTEIAAGGAADAFNGNAGNQQIALVAFHTCFNVLGVMCILPFAHPFARLITRLVPERGPALQQRLDAGLLRDPAAAVDALVATLREIALELMSLLKGLLNPKTGPDVDQRRLAEVDRALASARDFVGLIRSDSSEEQTYLRHLSAVHALDHLMRLSERCRQSARIEFLESGPRLHRLSGVLRGGVSVFLRNKDLAASEASFEHMRRVFRRQRRVCRERMVISAVRKQVSAVETLHRLDSVRWLHRVSYHLWRCLHHLGRGETQQPLLPSPDEVTVEMAED